HELVEKLIVDFVCNKESLCCNARLSGVNGAGFDRGAECAFEIRAGHHDKGVAASKLEHTFLDLPCSRARHFDSSLFAARQRDRFHARITNYIFDLCRLDQERLENAVVESRAAKYLFDRKCALRHI